jgi:pimeloyl-ACP methyl ester carboxylesterase
MPIQTVNGINLYYEVTGEGPPLLFLHGLGSSSQDWELQVAEFAKDYRVVTLDLRGHGQSGKPRGPYSMAMLATDAAELLRSLGIASAHVVGLSLGGGVAFQLAVAYPGLVRSLVVVNSTPDAEVRSLQQRAMVATRFALIRLLGFRRFGKILAKNLLPEPELAAVRATFLERYARNDKTGYLAALRAFLGWSVLASIGAIACPTLIVAADNDYFPTAQKEAYVALIPGATLVVVPDSRHALPVERPQAFNAVLRRFLDAQPR